MSNMSDCRFRNTLNDLDDCLRAIEDGINDDDELSNEELNAAVRLVMLCGRVVQAVALESSTDGLAHSIVDGDRSAKDDIKNTLAPDFDSEGD